MFDLNLPYDEIHIDEQNIEEINRVNSKFERIRLNGVYFLDSPETVQPYFKKIQVREKFLLNFRLIFRKK